MNYLVDDLFPEEKEDVVCLCNQCQREIDYSASLTGCPLCGYRVDGFEELMLDETPAEVKEGMDFLKNLKRDADDVLED